MMKIRRIHHSSELDIKSFNTLLDEGVVWNEEQGKRFLSNEDNALFVAFEENHCIGFLTAHRLQRFDKRKAEVLLYEVGVDELFQRQGVGTALLAAVKVWAKEVEADEVWVLAEKSNQAAVGLYSSTGGKEDGPHTTMFTYKLLE